MIVIVNGYIGVLISALSSPFDLKSIHSFADLSVQHYNYEEIMNKSYWSKMGCGGTMYFWYDPKYCKEIPGKSYIPRQFNEEKDFRLLSSARSVIQGLGLGYRCNQSKVQWGLSSFSNKMVEFYMSDSPPDPDEYFDDKAIDKTNKLQKQLEVLLFNLIFPSHNGLPQAAINLAKPDRSNRTCELSDNNQFELEVEKELLKCGKTVFVDEHQSVLQEDEYLNKQYGKVKFFTSEQIWPRQRFRLFKTFDERPLLLEGIKTLLSNGIYYRTLRYFETFKYYARSRKLQETKSNEPEKQKMDGKFKSLFEVFLFVTLVCFLFFLFEKCHKACRVYWKFGVTTRFRSCGFLHKFRLEVHWRRKTTWIINCTNCKKKFQQPCVYIRGMFVRSYKVIRLTCQLVYLESQKVVLFARNYLVKLQFNN